MASTGVHVNLGEDEAEITGASLDAPADCTIACADGHITAHKLVLCDHSKYLKDILSKHPKADHPIIILTELNIIDIRILVNYMYTGQLVLSSDSSPTNLLKAAQILKIDQSSDEDQDNDVDDNNHLNHNNNHITSNSNNSIISNSNNISNSSSNCDSKNSIIHSNHHHNNNHLDDFEDDDIDDDHDIDEDDDINDEHHLNRHNNHHLHSSSNNNININTNNININNNNSNNLDNDDFEDDEDDDYIFDVEPDAIGAIGQSLAAVQELNKHNTASTLDNKNNKIRCHLCNIGLSDVKCLYRHVLTRHLPEKWGYKCEFCDREFSRDDHLMRHYTTKHKNMEFNREKIRETRRLNREMAKNFHDQISTP